MNTIAHSIPPLLLMWRRQMCKADGNKRSSVPSSTCAWVRRISAFKPLPLSHPFRINHQCRAEQLPR
jgi:hypothetical protein